MKQQANESKISTLGWILLQENLGDAAAKHVLLAASMGTHRTNPYHNLTHCLQVVYYSFAAANFSSKETLNWQERNLLAHAALFHDHNHSGGVFNDSENIKRATDFITSAHPFTDTQAAQSSLKLINRLIEVTEYSYPEFKHEPKSFIEMCIRDADLCAIYSAEGRHLLLGLSEELGHIKVGDTITREFVAKSSKSNRDFLMGATMYTEYGQYMKATHLEKALAYNEMELTRYANTNSIYNGPLEV